MLRKGKVPNFHIKNAINIVYIVLNYPFSLKVNLNLILIENVLFSGIRSTIFKVNYR